MACDAVSNAPIMADCAASVASLLALALAAALVLALAVAVGAMAVAVVAGWRWLLDPPKSMASARAMRACSVEDRWRARLSGRVLLRNRVNEEHATSLKPTKVEIGRAHV